MAILVSPGTDIQLVDESLGGSAGPGTVPLIVLATAANKTLPSGSGIAQGTLPSEAGKLMQATSQRDLVQKFGNPKFYVTEGTPLHGYELNEYGLLTAYQYLGIADRALIVRADVDTAQLEPSVYAPRGEAKSGTYWFDIASTEWGIFEATSAGGYASWAHRTPTIFNTSSETEVSLTGTVGFNSAASALNISETVYTLEVNGAVISGSASGLTVQDIVDAINNKAIAGITASLLLFNGKYYVQIKNSKSEPISVSSAPADLASLMGLDVVDSILQPKSSLGLEGSFGVITIGTENIYFQKKTSTDVGAKGDWYVVGSALWKALHTNKLFYAPHTSVPNATKAGDVWIKTTEPNRGANYIIKLYSRTTGQWSIIDAPMFVSDDKASITLGVSVNAGTLYVQQNTYGTGVEPIASHVIKRYRGSLPVEVLGTSIPGTGSAPALVSGDSFVMFAGQTNGVTKYATIQVGSTVDSVVNAINSAVSAQGINGVMATNVNGFLKVVNTNKLTLGFSYITDTNTLLIPTGDPLASLGITASSYSNWEELAYEAAGTQPTTDPDEGTMWYNPDFRVDIMVADGDEWKGYKNAYPSTDPNGAILAGSPPLVQTDGTPLVESDIWIDTSALEDYPRIYRWREMIGEWELIDNTDQTTPFGIVFSDARANSNGKKDGSEDIADMLVSNYLDPDAPDPRTYPSGVLLFNTRYSTYNVKEWKPTYFEEYVGKTVEDGVQYHVGFANFNSDTITRENMGRWVTVSGNKTDGSPWMGRKAQRQIIVRALAAVMAANQDIRSEEHYFNLIVCPGYPELIDEMVTLNTDKKEIAFIIGDTPARLKPDATLISQWAINANNAPSNGDEGLTTRNTYIGMYYPWGLSTDLSGNEAMIPPSAIALRTIAYNDNVAYPWFAPAGYNRGIVTNASTVGYLNDEDEYTPIAVGSGLRDALYVNNINPIAMLPNRGLTIFGQKTLHPNSTSPLSRINVVRLVNYLRYNLDLLAKPFLFEPNDKQTRDQVKSTFNRYMGNLITLRALYDCAVVCDETNNTGTRIDNNELWIDIAIQPVKSIEFIYIPIRIRNTGGDMSISTAS